MIEVKELKIGNWVRHFKFGYIDVMEVNLVGEAGRGTVNGWEDKEWFAIELTPEWLGMAGFQHEGERDGRPTYTKWEDVSCFRVTKGAGIGNYYYIPCYPTVQVRHLHQLQNLYFALMEEELEVKPLE